MCTGPADGSLVSMPIEVLPPCPYRPSSTTASPACSASVVSGIRPRGAQRAFKVDRASGTNCNDTTTMAVRGTSSTRAGESGIAGRIKTEEDLVQHAVVVSIRTLPSIAAVATARGGCVRRTVCRVVVVRVVIEVCPHCRVGSIRRDGGANTLRRNHRACFQVGVEGENGTR